MLDQQAVKAGAGRVQVAGNDVGRYRGHFSVRQVPGQRRLLLEITVCLGKALDGHGAVALVFAELVAQHRTACQQLAVTRISAHAGRQLFAHALRMVAYLLCVGLTDTEVIDQFLAFDAVALIEDVLVNGAGRADTALPGNLFQQAVQFVLLQRGCLSRRQEQGDGEQGGAAGHGAVSG